MRKTHRALVLFLLISSVSVYSQNLANERRSSVFTYIYRIPASEAEKILQKSVIKAFDISRYACVDSFFNDSLYKNYLPPGHYLYVGAGGKYLSVAYVSRSNLVAEIFSDYNPSKLFVRSRSGEEITNATIRLKNKVIQYDSAAHAYPVKFRNREKFVAVQANGDTVFYWISNDRHERYYENDFGWRFRNFGHRINSFFRYRIGNAFRQRHGGYLVFNKPKYLPSDTVKLKAYLTNGKGKPLKKPLNLEVNESYSGWKTLKENLAPVSDGAYIFEFALADTFKIDYSHSIRFTNKKGREVRDAYFKVEDYLLDVNQFAAGSDKKDYTRKDTLHFTAAGTDFNGLPVMDARVKLVATTGEIQSYYAEKVFVPDTLFSFEKNLDASGKVKFDYTASQFPSASFGIKIFVHLVNSNNEVWDTTFTANYNHAHRAIIVEEENDSITARYFKNGEEVNARGEMTVYEHSGWKELYTREVEFPFSTKIDAFASDYSFKLKDDTIRGSQQLDYSSEVACIAARTDSTAAFEVINPKKVNLHYSLYKNAVLVEKGEAVELSKKIEDRSDAVYVLFVQYVWRGESQTQTFRADKMKGDLFIDVKSDEEIYPGQKDSFEVSVTKFNGKAAPKTNLTAYSINAQFERDIQEPALPNYGKYKRIRKKYFPAKLEAAELTKVDYLPLSSEWRRRLRLDSLSYYQMIYPKKFYAYYLDSLPYITPQLAVYIYDEGTAVKIYNVHLDGKLVYTCENEVPTPYAFSAPEGFHRVTVRTQDRKFVLDSIYLLSGYKLELSYNYDSLLTIEPKPNCEKEYSAYEKDELKRSMISLQNEYVYSGNDSVFLWQGNRVFSADRYKAYGKIVGPFQHDSVTFYKKNRFAVTFVPEQDYAYSFSKGMMRLERRRHFSGEVKLHSLYDFYDELKFGELALYPPPIEIGEKNTVRPRYKFSYNGTLKLSGRGQLELNLISDSTFAFIHLFKADSVDFNNMYPGYLRSFYPLEPGIYQVEFITEAGNYCRRNVEVKANGMNYYQLELKDFVRQFPLDGWREKISDTMPLNQSRQMPYGNLGTGKSGVWGRVLDENREPLISANVVIINKQGEKMGTLTDIEGQYSINNIPEGVYDLSFSYLGYETRIFTNVNLSYGHMVALDVKMDAQNVSMSEVVVISGNRVENMISKETVSMSVMSARISRTPGVMYAPAFGGKAKRTYVHDINPTTLEEITEETDGLYNRETVRFASGNVHLQAEEGYAGFTDSGGTTGYEYHVDGVTVAGALSDKYANAKTLRNRFSDYGFWHPNIVTDENGKATFEVQYPDNLTAWKTYVIAMDGKRHSGYTSDVVRSYKELSASLATPQFLIEGDSTNLVCKISNYTGVPLKTNSNFILNGQQEWAKQTEVKDISVENTFVQAQSFSSSSDTIIAAFKISLENGFADGEERIIPVFEKGTVETKGQFMLLDGDTSFTFTPDANMSEVTLHAETDLLNVLLEEIKTLKDYPYWCTEQTASKLIALSMQEKIDSALGRRFKGGNEKQRLIKKLQGLQLYDGGFGWWQNTYRNIYISNHVLNALLIAGEDNFYYGTINNTRNFLKENISFMNREEKLNTLETLAKMEIERDFVRFELEQLRFDSLSLSQQMRFSKTQLLCGTDSAAYWKRLKEKKKETVFGGCYWGKDTFSWMDNSTIITLTAYEIAKLRGEAGLQQQILTYLLNSRGCNGWRNTMESANILAVVLPDVVAKRGKDLAPPVLSVNGKEVSEYPVTFKESSAGTVNIVKRGNAPLYFTAYQKFFNKNPEPVSDLFEVKTLFGGDNEKQKTLKGGELTEMTVTVSAKKSADYVCIEIPIPAGCTYAKKNFPYAYGEVHREYFKNKVVIFCENLKAGFSSFTIPLEPRYTGSYTVNPAKCELMYYPTFFGRNGMKRVAIEK